VAPSCQSGFPFLAADPLTTVRESLVSASALPASAPKTRVKGCRHRPSGRFSSRGRGRSMFTPGSRVCAYKMESGRHEWPNRDPDEESAGMSLYCFVQNEPVSSIDELGMIQFAGPYIHTDGIPPDLGAEPAASGVTVQTPLSFNITPIGCGFLWLGEKIQPLNFTVQFDIYFINAAAENQKTMTKETSLDHEKKHVQYLKEALSKVDKLVSGVGRICYYCEPCKTLRRDVVYKGVDDANAWRDYENDLLDYQDYFPGPYKDAKKAALVNDAAAFNAAKAAYNKAVNEYNAHCK
jgi:hypothetical protein